MDSNRDEVLLNRLKLKGRLELGEAMTLLQISESTARRLFSRLEEEGEAIRVHGGIRLPVKNPSEYSFEQVVKTYIEEKDAIGSKACDLLKEGDVLFCDTGTTVLCFCVELARRIKEKPFDIRVYTNSLAHFEVLASAVPITLIGGEYRAHRKDFAGYLTELVIGKLHFTKCFLGTDSCDMKRYFATTDFDTARMDEIAIGNSDETIILCDSSKFSASAHVGFASFADIDRLITDSGLPLQKREALERLGLKLLVAEV